MRRSELIYELPPERIAQSPAEPRDASRLLVLSRESGAIEHRRFHEIGEFLKPGDCLVLNDTRVLPARFFCRRDTGGRVEALFLHETGGDWRVLLRPSARLRVGERLLAETPPGRAGREPIRLLLHGRGGRGEWLVRPPSAMHAQAFLGVFGQTPLPPYIHRETGPSAADAGRYQTVYAARPGAAAAPTAGLHFTEELLGALETAGVGRCTVTLHVGVGTFAPIEVEDLAEHEMHAEWFELSAETVKKLDKTRRGGGRIVAVGTTSARVLESYGGRLGVWGEVTGQRPVPQNDRGQRPVPQGQCGWTRIFIYPPYRFRNVDALVTNFHLPGSTLLAMVMALAGPERIRAAYAEAIKREYRFYSYGDAMLIH